MTPLERAIAAGHPSVYRSDVVDAPPPRDTMSDGGGSAAADSPSPPSEFGACHSTASSIESLTDRLRRLRAGRHE